MMTRTFTLIGLLAVLGVTTAQAQQSRARKGFWIGLGGGFGSLGLSCNTCASSDRQSAGTAFLKMGGTLSDRWRLGGENDTWVKVVNGTTVVAGNVSLAAYCYPAPRRGFFLRGGAGFAFYQEQHATFAAVGLGVVLGAGYDFKIGGGLALTPVANFNWGSVGDVQRGLVTLPGVKQTIVQLALGLTWH